MTKNEAIRSIARLSSGTIAHIIGSYKYEHIDAASCKWIMTAAEMADNAFEHCEDWTDVLEIVNA